MLPPLSLELLFWRVTLAGTLGTETGAGTEGGRGTGTGAGVGGGDGAEGVSADLRPYSVLVSVWYVCMGGQRAPLQIPEFS